MTLYRIISEEVKQRCLAEIQSIYKETDVCIKPPNRSNGQNALWHSMLQVIADHVGETMETVKLRVKYAVLPLEEIQVGDKKYLHPVSSRELSKADFSRLIEATLVLGMQLNITLPSAAHYGLQEEK